MRCISLAPASHVVIGPPLSCLSKVDTVRMLVKECGLDVTVANEAGETAVHLAARSGSLKAITCLIKECGADPMHKSGAGKTAAEIAFANGHEHTVHELEHHLGGGPGHVKHHMSDDAHGDGHGDEKEKSGKAKGKKHK